MKDKVCPPTKPAPKGGTSTITTPNDSNGRYYGKKGQAEPKIFGKK